MVWSQFIDKLVSSIKNFPQVVRHDINSRLAIEPGNYYVKAFFGGWGFFGLVLSEWVQRFLLATSVIDLRLKSTRSGAGIREVDEYGPFKLVLKTLSRENDSMTDNYFSDADKNTLQKGGFGFAQRLYLFVKAETLNLICSFWSWCPAYVSFRVLVCESWS